MAHHLPRLAVAAVLAVALPAALMTPAGADEAATKKAEVAAIQVKLAQARQDVNNLLQKASDSAEVYNGAVYAEQQAEAQLEALTTKTQIAERNQRALSTQVEQLTVQQLQSGGQASTLNSLLGSKGPVELLERSAAYTSTEDAMTAKLQELQAEATVTKVMRQQAAAAERRKQAAVVQAKQAKALADSQLAEAKTRQKQLNAQRTKLLKRLAYLEKKKLAEIRARQAALERAAEAASAVAPSAPRYGGNKGMEVAIAFALAQVGKPYVWGATGPNSYDCSGLVMRALEQDGIDLPHFSGAQYASLNSVSVNSIRRGDLVFWSHGGPSSIHHVALYLGDGMIVEAPHTGADVHVRALSDWTMPDLAARPVY